MLATVGLAVTRIPKEVKVFYMVSFFAFLTPPHNDPD